MLGTDCPPDQIVTAARRAHAKAVGISVSASAKLDLVNEDLEWLLGESDDDLRVWVGGKRAKSVAVIHPRLDRVSSWEDLENALERLR